MRIGYYNPLIFRKCSCINEFSKSLILPVVQKDFLKIHANHMQSF
jgi:hypothetical protein